MSDSNTNMNENDSNDVPQVDIEAAKQRAYQMGRDWMKDPRAVIELSNGDDIAEMRPFEGLHGSAQWSNRYLPQLREMAGYDDNGMGTYTTVRDVQPSDGSVCRSYDILDELIDKFHMGAVDEIVEAQNAMQFDHEEY